jgi:hypothetical protein
VSPRDLAIIPRCSMCSGTASKLVSVRFDVIGYTPRI